MQIALVGDIMIQGRAAETALRDGGGELVGRMRAVLGPADVRIGNFETFICPPGHPPGTEWHSPPEAAEMVARAGFDAVSVVNGHAWDHGEPAIRHTLRLLQEAGVAMYGLGDVSGAHPVPLLIERQGVRIGLIGYSIGSTITKRPCYTGLVPTARVLARDVGGLRDRADIIIITVHAGMGEYPSPEMRSWARSAVAAGADAVAFHHSHCISGVERIGGGVAAYGLANIVAALDPPKQDCTCLRLDVREGRLAGWSYDVFFLDDRGFPHPGDAQRQQALRRRIEAISADLARQDYDRFYWATFSAQGGRRSVLRSWRRDLRTVGVRSFLAKLRRLRPYHLRLLWNMVFRR